MKNFRHAGITITNRKRSLRFYRDLLGLKIVKDMQESGKHIDNMSALKRVRVNTIKMAADDGNLIELLHYASHPRKSSDRKICSIGPTHIAFTVDDLDKTYDVFRKAGVKFNCPPQFSPDGYAKVTFCKDPDGMLIELVEVLKK